MSYNKKIILIFLILILVIAGMIFNQNKKDKALSNLTLLEEITTRIKTANNSLEIQSKDNSFFRWIKNDYTILVPATSGFFIDKQNNEHLGPEAVPKIFKKELSIIEKVLNDRGFVFNPENSSSNFSDRSFYDYIESYKKGDELCVVRVDPDDRGFYQLSFSCGNSLDYGYKKQIPFLKALELKNEKTTVGIKNQKENYYEVSVNAVRGGSVAVLKKENNTYRVLFIGQESPLCSLIEKENIPSEVLSSIGGGNCFINN